MANEDRIKLVLDNLKESFEDIGLYLLECGVATTDDEALKDDSSKDFRDKLVTGESKWLISATFQLGDVAFSDRVLNPDKFKEDQTFREMMPSEADLIRDRIRKAKEAGDITSAFEL